MESLSPQEILKLLEAEAESLQQMESKVGRQLDRLKLEEQLILQSALWMQNQPIAGDEDLAPLPRPLSPLHEAKVESVSTPETRLETNANAPCGEPPGFGGDMDNDSNPYELLEAGQSDDSEDDLD